MKTTTCIAARDFSVPREDRYFEDYVPDAVYEYGTVTMTEDEIITFAKQFDPQVMHTEPAGALAGPTKGLIASGMHTASLCIRLMVDHYLSTVATFASPGMDEVRFFAPVRPGDVLRVRFTITDRRVSKSNPQRGLVFTTAEMLNQDGVVVCRMRFVHLFARRLARA